MMKSIRWILAMIVAGLMVLGARPALACTCLAQGPACQAALTTPTVFLGRVVEVRNALSSGDPNLSNKLVRIAVIEPFRGLLPNDKEVTVSTGNGHGDCGYSFVVGAEYVVYARPGGRPGTYGTFETGICDRTQLADAAAEDLTYLRGRFRTPATRGQILGRVERWDPDETGGGASPRLPLAGVTVTMRGAGGEFAATSGADGRFVSDVPAGKYQVQAQLAGSLYSVVVPNPVEVINARGCGTVAITVRADGRVRGRAVDAAGVGIPALALELTRAGAANGAEGVVGRTAADGTFEIPRIPPGRYVLGLFPIASGAAPAARALALSVGVGETVALTADVVVPPGTALAVVAGVVRDARGQPVAGAEVYLRTDAPSRAVGDAVVTRPDGRFAFTVTEGARYRVHAERTAATGETMGRSQDVLVAAAKDAPPLALVMR